MVRRQTRVQKRNRRQQNKSRRNNRRQNKSLRRKRQSRRKLRGGARSNDAKELLGYIERSGTLKDEQSVTHLIEVLQNDKANYFFNDYTDEAKKIVLNYLIRKRSFGQI